MPILTDTRPLAIRAAITQGQAIYDAVFGRPGHPLRHLAPQSARRAAALSRALESRRAILAAWDAAVHVWRPAFFNRDLFAADARPYQIAYWRAVETLLAAGLTTPGIVSVGG